MQARRRGPSHENVGVPAAHAYPRFTDAEMSRRLAALEAAMGERGAEHVLAYGANRTGSAIGWLTRWPVTREALVVHTPGERPLLLVDFYNHVPNARRVATDVEVRWAGERAIDTALEELRRRGASGRRIGTIGALHPRAHAALGGLGEPVDMSADYTRLRLVKSPEEIEWVRIAARLTDAGVAALHSAAAPGVTELELVDAIARSSSFTVATGKRAFYSQVDRPEGEAYAHCKVVMTENALAHDAQEGMTSFLQKREPVWRGE